MDYLFVYGTLQNHFGNHWSRLLSQSAKFIAQATIQGQLYDIGDYPGLVASESKHDWVHGQVFDISQSSHQLLSQLDDYEGIHLDEEQVEYVREASAVHTKEGTLHCWIYWYIRDTEKATLIASGDYQEYLLGKC